MFTQTLFIADMSREQYDAHLADGWFRDSLMMYKGEMVILDGRLYSIVHIRLDLTELSLRKRQRKVMRKVESGFRTVIGKPAFTPARERLYRLQSVKFSGFLHSTLKDMIERPEYDHIPTLELAVYDGRKLIAVSYFDVGRTSMASLICVYDPEYASYSLGYYTMLKEAEWAKERGLTWYYPGYVFDRPSEFDYKLRLGNFQSMHRGRRWKPGLERNPEQSEAGRMTARLNELKEFLRDKNVTFSERLYPHFAAAKMIHCREELLAVPIYLEVVDSGVSYAACYDPLKEAFLLHRIEPAHHLDWLIQLPLSADYRENRAYEHRFMCITSSSPLMVGASW